MEQVLLINAGLIILSNCGLGLEVRFFFFSEVSGALIMETRLISGECIACVLMGGIGTFTNLIKDS